MPDTQVKFNPTREQASEYLFDLFDQTREDMTQSFEVWMIMLLRAIDALEDKAANDG